MSAPEKLPRVVASASIDLGGGIVLEGVVLGDGTEGFTTTQSQRVFGAARDRNFARQIARIPCESGPLALLPRTAVRADGGVVSIYSLVDFTKVCATYAAALAAGKLHEKQKPAGLVALAILAATSVVGLRALLYERAGVPLPTSNASFYSEVDPRLVTAAVAAALAPVREQLATALVRIGDLEREKSVLVAKADQPTATITPTQRRDLRELLETVAVVAARARGVSLSRARGLLIEDLRDRFAVRRKFETMPRDVWETDVQPWLRREHEILDRDGAARARSDAQARQGVLPGLDLGAPLPRGRRWRSPRRPRAT